MWRKKNIMSHHDFRKAVAMAWINPDLYWQEERNGPVQTCYQKRKAARSVSSNDSSSYAPKRQRCIKIFDYCFKEGGALRCRLDTSKEHFPTSAKGKSRCSLHKWVGIETQRQISFCATCNVNLCQDCFKYFHVTEDILGQKSKLTAKYKKEFEQDRARREANSKSKKPTKNKT